MAELLRSLGPLETAAIRPDCWPRLNLFFGDLRLVRLWGAVGRRMLSFVLDGDALERWRLAAKLQACPRCGCRGTLNAHGWLRGYSEGGSETVLRGQRFVCSNRGRRPGCGRTGAVMLARFLPGFSVTATTLCRFVIAVVIGGQERRAAWQRLSTMAIQTGYRLLARLGQAQPHLRAWLCRVRAPPPSCAQAPLSQLLAHLQLALPGAGCLLARFQIQFQVPALP